MLNDFVSKGDGFDADIQMDYLGLLNKKGLFNALKASGMKF